MNLSSGALTPKPLNLVALNLVALDPKPLNLGALNRRANALAPIYFAPSCAPPVARDDPSLYTSDVSE